MTSSLLGISLLAFVSTLLILPALSAIALRIGLVDMPGGRKVHRRPTALVGGIGMLLGLTLAIAAFMSMGVLRYFLAAICLMAVVGFADDYRGLGHRLRLVFQAMAACIIAYWGGASLYSFGDLMGLGGIETGFLVLPVTVFCIVGVINAINMIDGLDGLAGGISLICFASFAAMAWINGQVTLVLLGAAFCGVLLAFLRYNFIRATIFMGDAGSMALGLALAYMAIVVTQMPGSTVRPVTALLILAVPITDTLILMIGRVLRGQSPFKADKFHIHHILLTMGLGKTATVATILVISAGFSLAAAAGHLLKVPEAYQFALYVIYFITCLAGSIYFRKVYCVQARGLNGWSMGAALREKTSSVEAWSRAEVVTRPDGGASRKASGLREASRTFGAGDADRGKI